MEELINEEEEENAYSGLCLSELRKLKQNGTLDLDKHFAQQTVKWRNILKYNVLETYVGHYNEEYRLDILALLVESKKSTLRFTSKELDIILLFLKYNLCEKIEYVPLIKKALKRFRDSLAVMRRQWIQKEKLKNHDKKQSTTPETCRKTLAISNQTLEQIEHNIKNYTMFFVNLREICVNNLYPDATYHRRRSSLQILLLTQELLCNEFQDIEWREEQMETIFQCLLLDTYEPNKEMAYQLLKQTNPIPLCLNSKWQVQLIIKVALKLGKSIRPIDSITAAYMLKVSMLSPIAKDVLNNISQCFEEKENLLDYHHIVDNNITEATRLQLILLLYRKLKDVLFFSTLNIGLVFSMCSLYGYLFCMRSLLNDCDLRSAGKDGLWQVAVADIITLCIRLNHTVSVIVNNSSPEGHLPMDLKTLNFNMSSEKEVLTPQMVLLCSWRTVKEVSHLFGLFATEASIQIITLKDELLSRRELEQMMGHFVSLLCETKHRGAFEQAYVGFHQLCTRLWQPTIADLKLLPIRCLHDTLIGITGLIPGYSKLCATRRSAGVPFLIQGLVSSALKISDDSSKYLFCSVMKILLEFTKLEDTTNLWPKVKSIVYEDSVFSCYKNIMEPKIESRDGHRDGENKLDVTEIKTHSMNILRALFRHSQLSDMVKHYIADGLIVAFKHYDGKTWAERNAATLLFSALIVRIFGVQRTKDHVNLTTYNMMTGRLFFEKYPSLLPFILNELRIFISTNDTMIKSNVQAILLLLSRLYINNTHETDVTWKTEELRNLVLQCAKSPVYQTRELAARALIPLLTENTVCSTLTNLFQLIFKTTRDIRVFRISANLIHGYLLQILKILRKFPHVKELLKPYQVTDLLNILQYILSCLNRRSDRFNSFPLATVYVDILYELYKTEKDIINDCRMKDILHTLQQCLIEEDLSKPGQPWPGEQMYKVSIIRFVLCVGKYSNFLQTIHNGQSKAFEIWSRLLITTEAEVQSVAWSTVSEVLTREQKNEQRKLLGNYAILIAANFTEDLHKYNPDVQDAISDFLYNCLMNANEWFVADAAHKKHEICTFVLRKMHSHNMSNVYSQRINYLRLLGKCMTTLIYDITDEELEMEYKEDIYRKVCDNDWISSLCKDFRPSVFNILFDLFDANDIDAEHCHPVLDWWTMTLQLLVDDNVDVRCEACKLICCIAPSNELECIERMLPVFFQIFNNAVAEKCPEVAISALFCWSVSLLGDTDYEMDETDVFNKCRNYDVFEPVRISKMCYDLIVSIMQRYSIDNILPPDVIEWINYRLDTKFIALSFKEVARSYTGNMPTIRKKKLIEILDPTYKDKLLHVLACEKYTML